MGGLAGASLNNTTYRGALLKGATWNDGRTCGVGSIGRCE